MTVDQQAHDDLGAAPPVLGVTHPPQIILALGLEVERGEVVQAQGQAPTGGDVIEQGPGQALAVAPLLGPGQAGLQGAAVGRAGQPISDGTLGVSALEAGSIKRARTICSKARVAPDRLTRPQTGADRLDGLDQPARPAGGDRRPSHRTTVTRLLTGRLAAAVEYRPQVQDLPARQKPVGVPGASAQPARPRHELIPGAQRSGAHRSP